MEAKPRPAVIKWYKVYAAALAALYFLLGALFILAVFLKPLNKEFRQMPDAFFYGYLAFMIVLCLVFFAVFIVALFLQPKPWTWVYHLVLICIGLTSPCFLPASVPLLIYWIKPETKAYFGKQ